MSLILGFGYTWLIRHIYWKWTDIEPWLIPRNYKPTKKISIVVAARNEEKNIESCITSLVNQSYPTQLIEIIIVDDFSDDRTPHLIRKMGLDNNIQLLQLSEIFPDFEGPAFKKKAIATGIAHSSGEIILTTDADCVVPRHWAAAMISSMEDQKINFITGPIRLSPYETWLEKFQAIEMLAMNAITAYGIRSGKILLSNGANMAYKRELFNQLNGFDQVDGIASGDDVLFLQKVYKKHPDTIGYCKSHMAFVDTHPVHTLRDLSHQRIRWASKYNSFTSPWIKATMAGILFYCLLIILFILLSILINKYYLLGFIILIFFKGRIDYWFLKSITREFQQPELIKSFLTSFIFYPLQIIWIGLVSIFKKNYIWKGRKVH